MVLEGPPTPRLKEPSESSEETQTTSPSEVCFLINLVRQSYEIETEHADPSQSDEELKESLGLLRDALPQHRTVVIHILDTQIAEFAMSNFPSSFPGLQLANLALVDGLPLFEVFFISCQHVPGVGKEQGQIEHEGDSKTHDSKEYFEEASSEQEDGAETQEIVDDSDEHQDPFLTDTFSRKRVEDTVWASRWSYFPFGESL